MNSKRRPREDLGFHCDSAHEANVARILKYLGIEFKPYKNSKKNIDIEEMAGKLKLRNEDNDRPLKEMQPDFYVPKEDTYIEVKGGWGSFTSNDRKKLAAALLMNKKIVEICGITYTILERAFKDKIPEWES